MIHHIYSSVIFYTADQKILVQDWRNLGKDANEWGLFGGGREGDETPEETAIREIQEEINLSIQKEDLLYIGKIMKESVLEEIISEGSYFLIPWKDIYQKHFQVLEGAGYDWIELDDMRKRKTYGATLSMLNCVEYYFKKYEI